MAKQGKLIVLCGIDGAVKTTLIQELQKSFQGQFLYTREPGGTPEAEEIRNFLLSEDGRKLSAEEQMSLFFKARDLHLKKKIIPAINTEQTIFSDRFDCCTYVYQNPTANGIEKQFWDLRKVVVENPNIPIQYVYLEISAKLAIKREEETFSHNHFDKAALSEVEGRIMRYHEFFDKAKVGPIILNVKHSPEKVFQDFCSTLSI